MGSALVVRVVGFGCRVRMPVLMALVLAELALSAGFIFIRMRPEFYLKAFDIDNEQNFSAAFSAIQFLWIAGSITCFLAIPRMIVDPLRVLAWTAATGFVFLGFDEYTQVHERLSNLLVPYGFVPRFNEGVGAWISVYATAAVNLLMLFRRPVLLAGRLYPKPSLHFLAGLALVFLGSVGCEIIAFELLPLNRADPLYPFAVAAEEFLEMSGASLMLFAIATFGAAQMPQKPVRSQHISVMPMLKA